MKFKRLWLALSCLTLFAVSANTFAGDATFSWVKPNPAFTSAVPPGWVIDEYRVYCDTGGVATNYTVQGYDTESLSVTDLPAGDMSCYMTSWSAAAGLESDPSNTVTKTIYDTPGVNPPTLFDFAPAISALEPGKYKDVAMLVAGLPYRGDCSVKKKLDISCKGRPE